MGFYQHLLSVFYVIRKTMLLFGANTRKGVDEMMNQGSRITQLIHKLYKQMRHLVEFLCLISSPTVF